MSFDARDQGATSPALEENSKQASLEGALMMML